MDIKTVGIVGPGTMGHGIAQVFADHDFQVLLCGQNDISVAKGMQKIERSLESLVKKGRVTSDRKDSILQKITPIKDMECLFDIDILIEAIPENIDKKIYLLNLLDKICKPETILSSNTSSISLTHLAGKTKRPDKVIGMHFMNPVPLMKLVEIIRALQTSDETYYAIEALSKQISKVPITVNDSPGFISNRILMPMINEAIYTLHEGIATPEAIDEIMKLGMAHPMGPLTLADLIGLDTCLSIMQVLHEGLGDKYRPCPLLIRMVDAGYLGRKTGRGFYTYEGK